MAVEYVGDILRLLVLGGLGAAGVLAVLIWKKNLATRVSFLRLIVQLVAFAAIFYVFTYSDIIPMLFELLFIFGLTLILGRFFCGWLCPFGLIMDLEMYLRRLLKIRHRILPDKLNIALHKGRYLILLVFLLTPALLYALDPQEIMVSPIMANVLAGHYRGYSILLDPMIPFVVPWTSAPLEVGGVYLSYPYTQNIITLTGEQIGVYLAIAFVVATLIGSFFVRRLWCRFCPTGASFGALNQFKGFKALPPLYVDKDEEKCTKCGVCKRVCTVQVNEVYDQKGGKIGTSQCMLCARCVEMCPYEDALKIKLGKKTLFRSRNWLEPSQSE